MKLAGLAVGIALVLGAVPALAADVAVEMLNKGDKGAMLFQPDLVRIAVGDTVTFTSVDKGHNVAAIPAMLPAGAEPFKSKLSETFTQTFTVPGIYAVRCDPHYAMGMVALVVVGDDLSNLDAVKAAKTPKKPHERFEALIAELGQ